MKHINPAEAGDAPTEDYGDPGTSEDVFVPDDVQFNIFNTDRRLSAVETLARIYREYPERKSLVYFSSGMTTGIENQSQIRSTVDAGIVLWLPGKIPAAWNTGDSARDSATWKAGTIHW